MNAKVEKIINGRPVIASPVFKGGTQPAYWACVIEDRVLTRTFPSARDVFRFAEQRLPH